MKGKLDCILEHLAHAWHAGGYSEFATNPDVWPPEVPANLVMGGDRARAAYHVAAVIEYAKIWHDQLPDSGGEA